MKRKTFITLLILSIIMLCSSTCFATTDFETEMQDSMNKTENSMQNAGTGVMNFANNIGNGVKDMAEGIGNGIRDTADGIGKGVESMFDGDDQNTTSNYSYNAIRTSTDTDVNNGSASMANTAWIWLILGITGIIIVALTWYYVSQDTGRGNRN